MFRRWAENRMYRNTMLLAVQALRGAARSQNALEKLRLLDTAEQKLRDARWLRPELADERFEESLSEIAQSRKRTLKKQAMPAVDRLLEAAEKGLAEKGELLRAAGELLAFLHQYLPEDAETLRLSARFRSLGGKQIPYRPAPALSDRYQRVEPGAGCATLIAIVVVAAAGVGWWVVGVL